MGFEFAVSVLGSGNAPRSDARPPVSNCTHASTDTAATHRRIKTPSQVPLPQPQLNHVAPDQRRNNVPFWPSGLGLWVFDFGPWALDFGLKKISIPTNSNQFKGYTHPKPETGNSKPKTSGAKAQRMASVWILGFGFSSELEAWNLELLSTPSVEASREIQNFRIGKTSPRQPCPIHMRRRNALREAFTLIELLVVMAILAVLLALIVSTLSLGPAKAKIELAQTELGQLTSAIQDFKDTLGFYPPDNPNNPAMAPLYFELLGTTNDNNNYITLDASGQIARTDINTQFSRQGFANTGTQAHGSDEKRAPMPFLNHLRPMQLGQPLAAKPLIKILVCSIEWPPGDGSAPIPGSVLNPWCYVSSHPTNNSGSYDLWADVPVGGKVYRVCNWSREPEIIH